MSETCRIVEEEPSEVSIRLQALIGAPQASEAYVRFRLHLWTAQQAARRALRATVPPSRPPAQPVALGSRDIPFPAKIHASLELLRCTQCHGADRLRGLAIKSSAERMRIIRDMIAKPGSSITPDEVTRISRSFEQMLGF